MTNLNHKKEEPIHEHGAKFSVGSQNTTIKRRCHYEEKSKQTEICSDVYWIGRRIVCISLGC